MTFSISFPSMLRRTIGCEVFGESCASLFSLEIIIDVDLLKCEGQKLRLIYELVILTKFVMHLLSVIRILR